MSDEHVRDGEHGIDESANVNEELDQNQSVTIICIDGALQNYDGSIMELCSTIAPELILDIYRESVIYKIFLKCLKSVAFPLLHEKWEIEDEWWMVQLEQTIQSIKNLHPLISVNADIDEMNIEKLYTKKMSDGSREVNAMIENIKNNRTHANISRL